VAGRKSTGSTIACLAGALIAGLIPIPDEFLLAGRLRQGEAIGGELAAAATAPTRINSARVLVRSAEEPGPYHNFPTLIDDAIFKGKRAVVSDDYVLYTRRGTYVGPGRYDLDPPRPAQAIRGTYEIGVRPSPSGRTEVITHRFFRPDQGR
jgi:hypothetical protein